MFMIAEASDDTAFTSGNVLGSLKGTRLSARRFTRMRKLLLAGFALISACDALPRDPAGTTDRIVSKQSIKVGFADRDAASDTRTSSLIRKLEATTHAKAVIVDGSGETQIKQLENGDLDLVIGSFTADSPWKTKIAFAPALRTSGKSSDALELKAAIRNGENRWIMTVEVASRAVAEPGVGE